MLPNSYIYSKSGLTAVGIATILFGNAMFALSLYNSPTGATIIVPIQCKTITIKVHNNYKNLFNILKKVLEVM